MKAEIIRDSDDALRVEIHCRDITDEVSRMKRYIEKYGTGITANEEGSTCIISIEEILDRHDFFRCSKSVIININKVVRIKPEINRNILATLTNGEVVVISRRYAAELKKLIGV